MLPLPMLRDWKSTNSLWVRLDDMDFSKWDRERYAYPLIGVTSDFIYTKINLTQICWNTTLILSFTFTHQHTIFPPWSYIEIIFIYVKHWCVNISMIYSPVIYFIVKWRLLNWIYNPPTAKIVATITIKLFTFLTLQTQALK